MAQELGMNPKKLIKNVPAKTEPWKAPVHVWIRDLYEERQRKAERERQAEAQQLAEGDRREHGARPRDQESPDHGTGKSAVRRKKEQRRVSYDTGWLDSGTGDGPLQGFEDDEWNMDGTPRGREIAEENESLLRRHAEFRQAAISVAAAFAEIPAVSKVSLFGSVASLLSKEVPQLRRYRKAGIALWHECKDVDLAVWLDELGELRRLQKARSRALARLYDDRQIGVAHHQVDVFILEPGSDRYLGRLCGYAKCPKHKPECQVAGCGAAPFLKQHANFTLRPEAIAPDQSEVLYDRDSGISGGRGDGSVPF